LEILLYSRAQRVIRGKPLLIPLEALWNCCLWE